MVLVDELNIMKYTIYFDKTTNLCYTCTEREVVLVATKKILSEIKQHLDASIGKRIKLKANRGRKKVVEKLGVLEQTYPHIFVVRLDENRNTVRRVSFSYTDILTETVELTVYKDKEYEERENIV